MMAKMSNIRPIRSQVLIRPLESDGVSAGGIFVPESYKEPSNKGEVVAVGNGTKVHPMKFKPGQTAFRVKGWGQEIEENGVKMFLMDQDALLATI
jgi:chaperonin GroES